ncbi:hypothetical protein Btru_076854 [Bulinus truncatus]|nr:hypothetical protein Btru_076854 [Bulinus truncatus]
MNPYGDVMNPYGDVMNPYGDVMNPYGDVMNPYGDVMNPYGDVMNPYGDVMNPYGDVMNPYGDVMNPYGDVMNPYGDEGHQFALNFEEGHQFALNFEEGHQFALNFEEGHQFALNFEEGHQFALNFKEGHQFALNFEGFPPWTYFRNPLRYVLRHSLFIYEYDYFESDAVYRNKHFVGEINAEDEAANIISYSNYVVVDLRVSDANKINFRVDQYIIDYHGFNITFLMLPLQSSLPRMCSLHHCTYLGNCMVTADYSTYHCECFPEFWGTQCTRGPLCDPASGKNICLNGGECTYVFGSQFNACECPPNYSGVLCDIPFIASNKKGKLSSAPSYSSDVDFCDTGTLQENRNTNSTDEEQFRIFVHLNILDGNLLEDQMSDFESYREQLMDHGSQWLEKSEIHAGKNFIITSMNEQSIGFLFYVDKRELPYINQSLWELIHVRNFFGFPVSQTQWSVQINPALKFVSLEINGENSVIEGKMLTLTCTARGSEYIQFKWFKNGKPLNLSLTHRNAWEIHLPENIQGKHISVLNIDGISVYDEGKFTCEVSDFGCKQNESLFLNVLPLPVVQVDPVSASILEGSSQNLRCISAVDKQESSTYTWLKNNRILSKSDDEIVEIIHPTGSHLLITHAVTSTNYTCRVTNKAGTSAKTVSVIVIANYNRTSCPSNKLQDILWNQTFGGYFNLQRCPRESDGSAKRFCNCNESSCEWSQPNYAQCHWRLFINVFDGLRKIQMGYAEKTLIEIFQDLYQLTKLARYGMYAGDLDLASKILLMIVTTARDFPSLLSKRFKIEELVELMNILFVETFNTTTEEREELLVGQQLLQTVEFFTDLNKANLLDLTDVEDENISLKVAMITPSSPQQIMEMTNKTYIDLLVLPHPLLVVKFDHSFLHLIENESSKKYPFENFISNVYSYYPLFPSQNITNNFIVNIPHNIGHKHSIYDTVYCVSWEKSKLGSSSFTWENNSCSSLKTVINQTHCLCTLPGHFTLVSIKGQYNETLVENHEVHAVLIVAQSLSIISLFFVLVIYLRAKRSLQETKNAIHFNFTISIVGINLVCMLCLIQPKKEMICLCGKILLQLYTIGAFTFLLLDAVQILLDIHARQHSNVIIGTLKFIIIGWGLPTLSVVCAILTLQVAGYDKQCYTWCWWTPLHHHFHSVIITVILLILGQSGILAVCVVIVSKWKDEWSYRDRRNSEIGKGIALQILLIIFVAVGISYNEKQVHSSQIVILLCNIILDVTIFCFFVIWNKKIRVTIFQSSKHWRRKENISFCHQETPTSLARIEMERIHEYCDQVDRERYTAEHKRQLRFLLSNNNLTSSSSLGISSLPKLNGFHGLVRKPENGFDGRISLGTENVQFVPQAQLVS